MYAQTRSNGSKQEPHFYVTSHFSFEIDRTTRFWKYNRRRLRDAYTRGECSDIVVRRLCDVCVQCTRPKLWKYFMNTLESFPTVVHCMFIVYTSFTICIANIERQIVLWKFSNGASLNG